MSRTCEISLTIVSRRELEDQLSEVKALTKAGHHGVALLLGWSVLEALARMAFPDRLAKPQRPGSVLEMLAYGGYISPTQADKVRPLIALRNRFVHGELAVLPASSDIAEFVRIIERVFELVLEPEAA